MKSRRCVEFVTMCAEYGAMCAKEIFFKIEILSHDDDFQVFQINKILTLLDN